MGFSVTCSGCGRRSTWSNLCLPVLCTWSLDGPLFYIYLVMAYVVSLLSLSFISSCKGLTSEFDIDLGWRPRSSAVPIMKTAESRNYTANNYVAPSVLRQEPPTSKPLGCRGTGIQRSSCYTVVASPSNPPIEALGRAVNLKRHELGSDYAATASKNRPRAINDTSKLIWGRWVLRDCFARTQEGERGQEAVEGDSLMQFAGTWRDIHSLISDVGLKLGAVAESAGRGDRSCRHHIARSELTATLHSATWPLCSLVDHRPFFLSPSSSCTHGRKFLSLSAVTTFAPECSSSTFSCSCPTAESTIPLALSNHRSCRDGLPRLPQRHGCLSGWSLGGEIQFLAIVRQPVPAAEL